MPPLKAPPERSEDVLDTWVQDIPSNRDVVLIAHSNAGLYVPPLTPRRRIVAGVFVDARLPAQEGVAEQAPADFLAFLTVLADGGGVLPPWTQWWPEEDTAGLFPDAETRAAVEQEQHRVPLQYFRDSVTAPAGWDEMPCAYLAFGDAYAAEQQDAAHRGWPVRTLEGGHLHMLVAPAPVAATIDGLLEDLRVAKS